MIIVKVGGGAEIDLEAIVLDLKSLREPYIIVHGANALRDKLAERLSVKVDTVTSLSGVSSVLSDQDLIDVMLMSYSGLRNKRLVEMMQRNGIQAIGLTGIDGGLIIGEKNSGIKTRRNEKTIVVRDLSGKPRQLNTKLLTLLLENGYVPVITVPILSREGEAINSENDDIVALIHSEIKADTVMHLIEAPGFLRDGANLQSKIDRLTRAELREQVECATGRFKRKLMAIAKLLEVGNPRVIIADGRVTTPIQGALAGSGTTINA